MKALILAGGQGTRLRPLTLSRPKHLLPIANRAHIDHVFDLLLAHGVDEAVLLTSYLAERFEEVVGQAAARGLAVDVAHEPTPLDTAGAMKNAEASVATGTFLAINGDVLTQLDLGRLVDWHTRRGALATVALTPVEDPSAYGVVVTEEDGRVTSFIEKPSAGTAPTNLINAGVYVFEPEVLGWIPSGERYSVERALFPGLVAAGAPLYAAGSDAYWMDVGTAPNLLQANLDSLSGRFLTTAVPEAGPEAVAVAPGVQIGEGTRVVRSCVGEGSDLADAAGIEESVLLPGVKVGRSASVRASVLGEGVVVQPGAQIAGRTVADGDVIFG
ncbi:MAG: NDP-sugar synthase [Actinobacteria bacterium]|nr:NDP-sugar synthase [Actinomycetota bacterium]